MGNLRRTINFMKGGAQNREAARRLPRWTKRATEEVSEENIATMAIMDIQTILNEDIDLPNMPFPPGVSRERSSSFF